ncbi:ferritin-like domain-containing protein [Antribacter sp. KLBMP9083]|uniref:Ferritin-like domain-containing protein n=1 Tax=Antribacter soli TaxID=2910976 RepID=A0AA41U968_9MICO|nr:ferritin-like fold-containing protein [Antribacter soli]MCF4123496.1 ferritin-like domain-containing protein [Antribacter soli]
MTEQRDARVNADDVLEVLGLAAYTDLGAFSLVASQAAGAPGLAVRQRVAGLAAGVIVRQTAALALAARHGADAQAAMGPFDGLLDDFDARTVPMNWWEAVVKAYVGHAVAGDLCRTAAHGLPPEARDEVLAVLDGAELDAGLADLLADAVSGDSVLAARLALWGRRVVGEALGVAQRLLATRPQLTALVGAARTQLTAVPDAGAVASARVLASGAGGSGDGQAPEGVTAQAGGRPTSGGDAQAWMFSRLTAEHTRRMDRLGMAA